MPSKRMSSLTLFVLTSEFFPNPIILFFPLWIITEDASTNNLILLIFSRYRWQLGRELAFVKMHMQANQKREEERAKTAPPKPKVERAEPLGKVVPSLATPTFLFDIGKGQYVTPFEISFK